MEGWEAEIRAGGAGDADEEGAERICRRVFQRPTRGDVPLRGPRRRLIAARRQPPVGTTRRHDSRRVHPSRRPPL